MQSTMICENQESNEVPVLILEEWADKHARNA